VVNGSGPKVGTREVASHPLIIGKIGIGRVQPATSADTACGEAIRSLSMYVVRMTVCNMTIEAGAVVQAWFASG